MRKKEEERVGGERSSRGKEQKMKRRKEETGFLPLCPRRVKKGEGNMKWMKRPRGK